MRRWFRAAAVGAPIVISLILVGCGRPKDEPDAPLGEGGGVAAGPGGSTTLQPLPGKAGAVLKGHVRVKAPPDLMAKNAELRAKMEQSNDKDVCYTSASPEERSEQQLILDDQGGVRYAVVWIQPPDGYFFAVDPKDKAWPDNVDVHKPKELKQPHCAFIPHVDWVVPEVLDPAGKGDPGKTIKTGQALVVSNGAKVAHNTKWDSSNSPNSGSLGTLGSGDAKEVPLRGNNALVQFSCNIHPWMNAYVWVFDHPYAAVTDEHGYYEIKNVPVGSKVRITAWHELGPNKGFLKPSKIKGEKIKLEVGENVHDFTLDLGGQ